MSTGSNPYLLFLAVLDCLAFCICKECPAFLSVFLFFTRLRGSEERKNPRYLVVSCLLTKKQGEEDQGRLGARFPMVIGLAQGGGGPSPRRTTFGFHPG